VEAPHLGTAQVGAFASGGGSLVGEDAVVPGARLPAEVGRASWADREKPGFRQHSSGRSVLRRDSRSDFSKAVPRRCQIAQLTDHRGGQTSPGRMLSDSVTEFCRGIVKAQVEATQDRTVFGEQDVARGAPRLLLGQQSVVPLGEVSEKLIASVGDRCSKVSAVRQLEVQYRRGVVNAQPLQIGHLLTLHVRQASDVRTSALMRIEELSRAGSSPAGSRSPRRLVRAARKPTVYRDGRNGNCSPSRLRSVSGQPLESCPSGS